MRGPQQNKEYNSTSEWDGVISASFDDGLLKRVASRVQLGYVEGITWVSQATILGLAYLCELSAEQTPWLFGTALLLAVAGPVIHSVFGAKTMRNNE